VLNVLVALSLARVPAGSSIRPMGEFVLMLIFSLLWLGFGIILLAIAWSRHRYVAGIVCLLLGLMPWVLGVTVTKAILQWHNLTLEP